MGWVVGAAAVLGPLSPARRVLMHQAPPGREKHSDLAVWVKHAVLRREKHSVLVLWVKQSGRHT